MNLSITSETGRLKGVVVHTPGNEVSLVNPELKDELLFDDIIFLDDARQEHIHMLEIFEAAMPADGRIFQITDLFLECLQNGDVRKYFIELLINALPEDNLQVIEDALLELQPKELLQFVIEGATPGIPKFTLHPTPNLLFTRDLAAVVGNQILLSRPAKKARLREALLTEMLVMHHPLFAGLKNNLIQTDPQDSIEGGDVLVVNEKLALIGMSERTSFSALMTAADKMLDKEFETILAVDIPKQRSSMHLDTIFTFAGKDECIVFPPSIIDRKNNVTALSKRNGAVQSKSMPSLKIALEEFMERDITFIRCGGKNRTNQFREQWTDGANVLALASGIIVGYERNTNTFHALKEHGYNVVNQYEFIEEFKEKKFDPSGKKIAIHFEGNELCRGRGGARCMTMPILRET